MPRRPAGRSSSPCPPPLATEGPLCWCSSPEEHVLALAFALFCCCQWLCVCVCVHCRPLSLRVYWRRATKAQAASLRGISSSPSPPPPTLLFRCHSGGSVKARRTTVPRLSASPAGGDVTRPHHGLFSPGLKRGREASGGVWRRLEGFPADFALEYRHKLWSGLQE